MANKLAGDQNNSCLFCRIVRREVTAHIVFDDDVSLAFLDHRPLFLGHCLLVPKQHIATLADLPLELAALFFRNLQTMASSVEIAMQAEGTFLAINNKVSQSVPHLHVHIVPRRKGDGLKGFFWPRKKYPGAQEMAEVAAKIRTNIL